MLLFTFDIVELWCNSNRRRNSKLKISLVRCLIDLLFLIRSRMRFCCHGGFLGMVSPKSFNMIAITSLEILGRRRCHIYIFFWVSRALRLVKSTTHSFIQTLFRFSKVHSSASFKILHILLVTCCY